MEDKLSGEQCMCPLHHVHPFCFHVNTQAIKYVYLFSGFMLEVLTQKSALCYSVIWWQLIVFVAYTKILSFAFLGQNGVQVVR